MRIIILSIFIGLCCLQATTGNPEPFFGGFFNTITNTVKNVAKTVTNTAANIVDAGTSIVTNTADAAANIVSDVPIVGDVAKGVVDGMKEAEKVIDNTADTMANITNDVVDNMADMMNAMAQPFDLTSGTTVCESMDGILNSLLGNINTGRAVPANAGNFLNTAAAFTSNLLTAFGVPNFTLNDIARALGITDIPDLISNVLTNGTGAFNSLFNNGTIDFPALFGNLTNLALNAAALALLPFIIKLRLKILIALTALNLAAQIANATING